MTDIYSLLSLPSTSNAFTALSGPNVAEAGSASPPRKVARLATDSDSASASRSRLVVIRPYPESRADEDSRLLKRCLRVLLVKDCRDALPATYEEIYRACRAVVCVHGRGEGLYGDVRLELERCIGSLSASLLENQAQETDWLLPFIEVCVWFERQANLLQSVLTYLDRIYVPTRKEAASVRQLAYNLFAERIFENAAIVRRLQAGIKAWIECERTIGTAHKMRPHIPALIRHLSNHGRYTGIFESYYVDLTHEFYTEESTERAEALRSNAQDFLQHCTKRRLEEQQRAKDVLPESSCASVMDTTDKALLTGRLDWLAKDALGPLIDARNHRSLDKMYRLFAGVGGLKVLCAAFKLHVHKSVSAIVKDPTQDEEMVPRLLEFKAFADKLVNGAFADEVVQRALETTKSSAAAGPSRAAELARASTKVPNQDFGYALIDAFASGFKARRNKPAEMIAKYLDRAMRKGQKGKKDEDFQAELDAALGLYRFTDDKDVFRTFYHRALAKRLLLERSASDDSEKGMLKRLKEQYDPEFGMGDHMFNDLALSRDMMREFIQHRARLGDPEASLRLSVMVLQRSVWPFAARKHDADLPPSMQDELTRCANFYKSKHSGRKLDWDHALGTAILRASFKNGEKELSVSLYQALILLLFNDNTEIAYNDIKAQTRMEDAELRRTLQSLALGKKRVLRKSPAGKDVNDDDVFHFNPDFTDTRYQVHISSIQTKETPEESKRTQTAIESDRKHALDAAIVRVMKARKELNYEQLKTETIEAVKKHFVPDVSSIKQRIASLVEQDYLRRDEDDMSKYLYVA
ncbi:hypothetical protein POSPLADRAFT_1064405 [Postia placenta MAD-698-R-SB12]|uniref:Cullin family profile domain-containing protein n=1 Tax=Postia placenta MAD-698-R-SB12 TaxID=670580 RepID=A0A1X6NHB8_9APHY|nr:hypothetical protein POSPLADRAFT_1064405 [Postia placenta MAD-698-R-SB12]OSX68038.1 hypothetical protein POSPLADRAFT_1064405 [Postia placenta MAD-698-R-SB12]